MDDGKDSLIQDEAEASVLGTLLLDQSGLEEAVATLQPDDFAVTANRLTWEAIGSAFRSGGAVDFISVCAALRKAGTYQAAGGKERLIALASKHARPVFLAEHLRVVVDASCVRAVQAYARRLSEAAGDVRASLPEDVAAFCQDAADGLSGALARQSASAAGTPLSEAIEKSKAHEAAPQVEVRPTGLPDLDGMIGGLRPGAFYVFGARPGAGKSTMLLNLAIRQAEGGVPGLIVSLEMSDREIADRARLFRPDESLGRLPIEIHDPGRINDAQLRVFARDRHRRGRCKALYVDYLQLVGARKAENRLQEVSAVSRELKAIARDLGIPVVAAVQLNRMADENEPQLSHLRESGQIEADADVVALLWVPKDQGVPQEGVLKCKVAKNRHGRCGIATFAWRAARFSIDSYQPSFTAAPIYAAKWEPE